MVELIGVWSGRDWKVSLSDRELLASGRGREFKLDNGSASGLSVRRRWFRWSLFKGDGELLRLRGIKRHDAAALRAAVERFVFAGDIADAVAWQASLLGTVEAAIRAQRWIPREAVESLLASRPQPGLLARIRRARYDEHLSDADMEAARALDSDVEALVLHANEQIMEAELVDRREFFDTIEKTPLTEEQTRAVVCFDNRVQLVAAAGSGKTSVMVARAAYAVSRGFVPAERVLLLAFNKAAATELQTRIAERFQAAGLDATSVRASTFHSFGLDVIGRATGEKPRLASWLDQGGDVRMILRIVDELRDSSETFRYRWDLYRTLFALAPTDLEEHEPDGYDPESRETGYRTFGGDVVKSHGERLIANFLYLNGVTYAYERPYSYMVADGSHSQYRPDFYYPDIDVWHEHWALDRDGRPPASFVGYQEGIDWKRQQHANNGTELVESTWAEVVFGDGLSVLERDLSSRGLAFDWNPDRPIDDTWATPMEHEDLARFVRTFMTHVKSNSWTPGDLDARLNAPPTSRLAGYRTRLFLDIYWEVHDAWQRRLAGDGAVDFEDMLVRAADCLEGEGLDVPYDLVLVDELQDASKARARLVRGLLGRPGRYLLAVGDDWQSINRFAGADISVMTDFESWFGPGPRLSLTTTFRCPQTICNVASRFVAANPSQLQKPMRSARSEPGEKVSIWRAEEPAEGLATYLDDLSTKVTKGAVPVGPHGQVSVDVLGRYRFEKRVLPTHVPANLRVTFRTVHSAKGLEADYVVVPGVSTGTYGFPSTIADDPVLELAMPTPEQFPHAEERRLLYVALTRARRSVTLFTSPTHVSPFVVELMEFPDVTVIGDDPTPVEVCARCRTGVMVKRRGPYSEFLGCSRFPACRHTRSL